MRDGASFACAEPRRKKLGRRRIEGAGAASLPDNARDGTRSLDAPKLSDDGTDRPTSASRRRSDEKTIDDTRDSERSDKGDVARRGAGRAAGAASRTGALAPGYAPATGGSTSCRDEARTGDDDGPRGASYMSARVAARCVTGAVSVPVSFTSVIDEARSRGLPRMLRLRVSIERRRGEAVDPSSWAPVPISGDAAPPKVEKRRRIA